MTVEVDVCKCCHRPLLSTQRVWQMRKKEQGLCISCGKKKIEISDRCMECYVKMREAQRRRQKSVRRYNSASYRIAKHHD